LRLPPVIPKSRGLPHALWKEWDLYRCMSVRKEPLDTWRFFSKQAEAVLRIELNLRKGRPGETEDWSVALRKGLVPQATIEAQRACLNDVLDCWLHLGCVRAMIDRLSNAITWGGADLFGELAVQLSFAVRGVEGWVHCVVCGKPFAPKNRVVRGGVHYCREKFCQNAASAERSARYREQKRQAASEKGEGHRKLPFRGVYEGETDDPLFS
jgi:predicted nucleic acid-binding Zn ribbon protein